MNDQDLHAISESQAIQAPISDVETEFVKRTLYENYDFALRLHSNLYCQGRAEIEAWYKEMEGIGTEEQIQKAMVALPNKVRWIDLHGVAIKDWSQAMQRWESIRATAREELAEGHRAAEVLSVIGADTPFNQARFLALREELVRDWKPNNGVEKLLIDQMTQLYTLYEYWLSRLLHRVYWDMREETDKKQIDHWHAPKLTDVEAQDQAAGMVDKFQRMFLRAQRALRDMRRYAPVIVQNVGQVNLAASGGQQINVSQNPDHP